MAYEPREGSGVLFPERDKKNEKAPDFKGNILIGGNQIRIAGWKKVGQKGTFISLATAAPRPLSIAEETCLGAAVARGVQIPS